MLLVRVIIVLVVCIHRKLLTAEDDQCNFETPLFPGISCEDVYNKNSQSRNESGYYWILDGPTNVYCGMNYTGLSCEDIYNNNRETGNKNGYYPINTQWTFCNMTDIAATYFTFPCAGVGGDWRRIASFNISAGDECPTGWNKSAHSGVSFCRSPSDIPGCYSTNFSTNEVSYTRVCGRVRGYQKGTPDRFYRQPPVGNSTIDDAYVDGLSITHGTPRQHIWTYVVGHSDFGSFEVTAHCPCAAENGTGPQSFVGSNYYCESGSDDMEDFNKYYLSDPLWDGSGCSSGNTCCSNTRQPWFQHQLSMMTRDDVEARICREEEFYNEEILIDILEFYIQ